MHLLWSGTNADPKSILQEFFYEIFGWTLDGQTNKQKEKIDDVIRPAT
jgi:hypothetical protein